MNNSQDQKGTDTQNVSGNTIKIAGVFLSLAGTIGIIICIAIVMNMHGPVCGPGVIIGYWSGIPGIALSVIVAVVGISMFFSGRSIEKEQKKLLAEKKREHGI